ncbi:MAG TPA: hypothetical protein VLU94_03470 [Candidatus Nitrosotalea sp.]|nr:hypothetical protein [Candidatus Nitrosotalea sp.]
MYYERLVWALPEHPRMLVKFCAGWTFRAFGLCRLLPAAIKYRVARLFSFTIRTIRDAFDAIPEDQLKKTVLFLSLRPHTREAKLAEAARFAGWRPLLVHAEDPRFDADKYFDFHAKVGGLIRMLLANWLFRGAIVHVFAPDGAQAYLLCVAKIRPLVLDLNDTLKSHHRPYQPLVWEQCEREAIRASNGMTHRDLRVKKLDGIPHYLPKHNLLMMDLVPEVSPRPLTVRRGDEIHVVSVGWIGRNENSILRSIKALCDDRIHVHLYINPLQHDTNPEIKAYTAFRNQSPYFHFEQPVFGEAYWDRLSCYDFGILIWEPFIFGEPTTSVSPETLKAAGSSRLTDYILSGLGVIMSPGLTFQWFIARRYASVVVEADRAFLESPRKKLEEALRRKERAKARSLSPITTRGAAWRLGEFYSRVAREGERLE